MPNQANILPIQNRHIEHIFLQFTSFLFIYARIKKGSYFTESLGWAWMQSDSPKAIFRRLPPYSVAPWSIGDNRHISRVFARNYRQYRLNTEAYSHAFGCIQSRRVSNVFHAISGDLPHLSDFNGVTCADRPSHLLMLSTKKHTANYFFRRV